VFFSCSKLLHIWCCLMAERKKRSNFAFEADAVRQRTVSCHVRAPRVSTRRFPYVTCRDNPLTSKEGTR
jgi:hypothetical protein